MQQRLLSPMIHKVGSGGREGLGPRRLYKGQKPWICAQPAHSVAEAADKECGTDTLLPGADVRAGL